MKLREAAEQALKVLEDIFGKEKKDVGAINALRQALSQTEPAPVGYVTNSGTAAYLHKGIYLEDDTPLYVAPPKDEWVGLTKEEAREISLANRPYVIDMIAALEAKLKEKNT